MNQGLLEVRFVRYDEVAECAISVFASPACAREWGGTVLESVRVEVWGHPGSFRIVGWYADLPYTPILASEDGSLYGGLPGLAQALGDGRYGGFA
ncbi:hypothetical protein [Achromobacter insuavis]|uniref:hypothetical protein n=1 Tax=Achromobacter insuavis TaxID=1287735 RepID=UPI001F135031|nr:hypothetical protein [Achromobacter insuavis]